MVSVAEHSGRASWCRRGPKSRKFLDPLPLALSVSLPLPSRVSLWSGFCSHPAMISSTKLKSVDFYRSDLCLCHFPIFPLRIFIIPPLSASQTPISVMFRATIILFTLFLRMLLIIWGTGNVLGAHVCGNFMFVGCWVVILQHKGGGCLRLRLWWPWFFCSSLI